MYTLPAIVLPRLTFRFAVTDSLLFLFNIFCTFGAWLLVTALSGTTSILGICLATSSMELGVSVLAVHFSRRGVWRLERAVERAEAPQDSAFEAESDGNQVHARFVGVITQSEQAEEALAARRRLMAARRRLSTEVVSVINELFTEFFATTAAAVCGVILHSSSVETLLDSDLSLEQLPLFAAVQLLPEIVDGWLIVAFLRYVGVDWRGLASSVSVQRRHAGVKVLACLVPMLYIVMAAMGGQ